MSTIRALAKIWLVDDYDKTQLAEETTSADGEIAMQYYDLDSDTKVELNLGSMTTASMLYIYADDDISVYINAGLVAIPVGNMLLITDTAITKVEVTGEASIQFFVAGT